MADATRAAHLPGSARRSERAPRGLGRRAGPPPSVPPAQARGQEQTEARERPADVGAARRAAGGLGPRGRRGSTGRRRGPGGARSRLRRAALQALGLPCPGRRGRPQGSGRRRARGRREARPPGQVRAHPAAGGQAHPPWRRRADRHPGRRADGDRRRRGPDGNADRHRHGRRRPGLTDAERRREEVERVEVGVAPARPADAEVEMRTRAGAPPAGPDPAQDLPGPDPLPTRDRE